MLKRIKRKIERQRLVGELTRMVGHCIGDFLGMSEHEDATKHGLRMMSIAQRNELMAACDRVRGWVEDVNREVFEEVKHGN
jgi:hypothetical protein